MLFPHLFLTVVNIRLILIRNYNEHFMQFSVLFQCSLVSEYSFHAWEIKNMLKKLFLFEK